MALVLREVARMEGLLGRVREITEIDARLEVEPAAPVDLGRLLADLAEVFRLRAGKGVRIELRAVPGVAVRAAPERLHQLFGNLVDNALGFSPEGGTVVVDLALDGDEARVRVEDEGPGIPEAHLGRIFDRFFRWRPDAGERQGHAGLGLAIARAIAEGYGGSIAVSNLSDRSERSGARFEVRLPALPQGQAAEPRPAAPVRKWSDAL